MEPVWVGRASWELVQARVAYWEGEEVPVSVVRASWEVEVRAGAAYWEEKEEPVPVSWEAGEQALEALAEAKEGFLP